MPKRQILIIDDEKDIVKLLQYNLEKEGYAISSALTGEQGLAAAKTKKPDLVILDLMLPGIDGLEVCRLLKSDRSTKQVPVLMLTAKGTEIDQVVGLEMGASDYVAKPFSVKVLLARVKNIFRGQDSQKEESTLLKAGKIVLNREKHSVAVNEKPVEFTNLEFKILAFLMENPGKVFSRERILDSLWHGESFVVDRSVDAHVKSIRQKLGKYRVWVETVRGSGYRFMEENSIAD